jgi:hypothetical protein
VRTAPLDVVLPCLGSLEHLHDLVRVIRLVVPDALRAQRRREHRIRDAAFLPHDLPVERQAAVLERDDLVRRVRLRADADVPRDEPAAVHELHERLADRPDECQVGVAAALS